MYANFLEVTWSFVMVLVTKIDLAIFWQYLVLTKLRHWHKHFFILAKRSIKGTVLKVKSKMIVNTELM